MSEQAEDRIRKLETQLAFLKGAAIVATASIAAFLGFTYAQIPEKVRQAVDGKIGQETMTRVKSFNDEYSKLAAAPEATIQKLGIKELLSSVHVEKVADYNWNRDKGQWNEKLIHKDEGFAAITSVMGSFDSYDSAISLSIDKEGYWRVTGNPKGGNGPGYGAIVSVFRLTKPK